MLLLLLVVVLLLLLKDKEGGDNDECTGCINCDIHLFLLFLSLTSMYLFTTREIIIFAASIARIAAFIGRCRSEGELDEIFIDDTNEKGIDRKRKSTSTLRGGLFVIDEECD